MNLSRLKKLSGINEDILTPDEQEEYDERIENAKRAKEDKIVNMIIMVFKKIGLRPFYETSYSVWYDDRDREATVSLEDNNIDIECFIKLKQSGLSTKYEVIGTKYALDVKFIVSPELDNAV